MSTIAHELLPDWLLIKVSGVLTREEVILAVDHVYPQNVSNGIIWDLSQANLDQLRLSDFQQIARHTRESGVRVAGRTAYVGDHEVFSQMCMYTAIAAMEGSAVDYCAFLTLREAELWVVKGNEFSAEGVVLKKAGASTPESSRPAGAS